MARTNTIRSLGLASVALGIFDYSTSDKQAGKVGMSNGGLFRMAGAREVISGAAMTIFPKSPVPIAARLIGDVADVAILAAVAARRKNDRWRAALIGVGMVVAIAAVDAAALVSLRRDKSI